MATNINIIVDFDGIVDNLKPARNTHDYTECDSYVIYRGKGVKGTTITLTKGNDYTFTLESAALNSSVPTKLKSFQSQDKDLTFKSDANPLQLKCVATKKDTKGTNVTFSVTFNNQKGTACTAKWDPMIIVKI